MRGTDLTQDQLDAAEVFLRVPQRQARQARSGDNVTLAWDDLVRLVAWYGAIRYVGGQKGFGTLQKPNQVGEASA